MLDIKVKGLDELKNLLEPQVVLAAAFSAVIRAVNGGKTDVSSEVRSTYNIKKSDFDKRIKLDYPADYDDITGAITVSGGLTDYSSSIPLIKFAAVGFSSVQGRTIKTRKGKNGFYSELMKRAKAAGVSHKVLTSGGKGFSKNAFIIPGGSGSLQIVRRTKGQSGRLAIKEMRTISPAAMVLSQGHGVISRLEKKLDDRLQKEFLRQLEYYQNKAASGQNVGGAGWNISNGGGYYRRRRMR